MLDVEKRRAYKREWQRNWRLANPEKSRELANKYRTFTAEENMNNIIFGNPEHELRIKKIKERNKIYARAYYQNNKIKFKESQHKYLARKRKATVGRVDLFKLINDWDRTCGICNSFVYDAYDIDHIIPLSRGGLHAQENLQLAHSSCNRRKGNRGDY